MGLRWSWKFFQNIVLAVIFMFPGFCVSDQAPRYSFVHEATRAPPTLYYDYIVIGGGTAGCPLAATLSRNATVLLLERGGSPYGHPNITHMANFATSLSDTSPNSPSQAFISEDGVFNARARVLGGGSALNAGFYTHASRDYIRQAGWNEALANKSYIWVEKKVAFEPPMLQWQSAVREGLLEVGVLPYNGFTYDHIYGTKVGGSIFDSEGHRHTAADLLECAVPANIAVYLHATVHKILFTEIGKPWPNPRAYGVVFEDARGIKHKALLKMNPKNEIILSAGAMGSPQLLMLSGIGPASELQAHGIPVVVDQPMVGQGMSDNPMNALFIPSPVPVEVSLIQVVGITKVDSFIETASGTSFAQRINGDNKMFLNQTGEAVTLAPEDVASLIEAVEGLQGGVILEKIIGPKSTGELRLRTTDPNDNPSVTFNYFQDPEDLQRCVQGMSTIVDIVDSEALSKFRFRNVPVQALTTLMSNFPLNLRPRHLTTAISLEQFCIDTVMTIWHYHGGCQVGKVVDRDYKVFGVDGLRVVDGSTFIGSPGTNPQATVMMLGRYMGRKILHGRFS